MAQNNFIPNGYSDSNEIKTSRTYNAKRFAKDSKNFVSTMSPGHIHYNNKMGFGDGNKDYLREIDYTLQDQEGGGWYFEYASFRPVLPADTSGWAEFRDLFDKKDATTKYKPVCDLTTGVKFDSLEGVTNGNGVLYGGAYGTGKDYVLYFIRSGLVKAVRVKEVNKGTEELRFRFQVDFDGRKVFRGTSVDDIAYEVDLTQNKTFDSDKKTFIYDAEADEYTQLETFKVWDDTEIKTTIEVDLIVEGGNLYLEKIIPASYITSSQGDILTDTTSTFYSGAGDGRVLRRDQANWAAAQGTADGNITYATADTTYITAGQEPDGDWQVARSFFPFDSSALPDTDTISAVSFKLYATYLLAEDDDAQAYLTTVQTSQASISTLANGDYDTCGDSVDNPTEGVDSGNRLKLGTGATGQAITTSAYNTFTLNATGIGWVSKTGYTKLGVREGHDTENVSTAGAGKINEIGVSTSEETGTSQDPILEVVHAAATAPLANFNGTALSALTSIDKTAKANISDVSGVSAVGGGSTDFNTKAIDLDGVNKRMANTTKQSIGIANVFTCSAWFKTADSIDTGYIITVWDHDTSSDNENLFYITVQDTGKMRFRNFSSSNNEIKDFLTSVTLSVDTIYHVIVTWDGTDLRIWINGTEDTSVDKSGGDNSGTMTDSNRRVGIGARADDGVAPYEGLISAVAFWDVELDSANKTAIYDSGNGFKKDLRNSFGNYDEQANLVHQWALGKDDTDASAIGTDYVSSGTINVGTNAVNITSADVTDFT